MFSIFLILFFLILLSLILYNNRAVFKNLLKSLFEWTSPENPFFISSETKREVLESEVEE